MKHEEGENEDFLKNCHDDSKFGGKSISSPIKSVEVRKVHVKG